jgi:hypothetical protein
MDWTVTELLQPGWLSVAFRGVGAILGGFGPDVGVQYSIEQAQGPAEGASPECHEADSQTAYGGDDCKGSREREIVPLVI